jgi:hypothetical protein
MHYKCLCPGTDCDCEHCHECLYGFPGWECCICKSPFYGHHYGHRFDVLIKGGSL